jgi:hypothetical protein
MPAKGKLQRPLFLLLALAAALSLAACGGSDSDSGDSSTEGGGDQFTTAAFKETLDQVKADVGEDAELLDVQITSAGTDYKIRSGDQATGLHFDPGSSDAQDVDVELIGSGAIEDNVFPISDVDPAAIDKMVEGAPAAIGVDDFEVTVMTLGLSFSGNGDVNWTINGDGSGRTALVLQADPDGSNLTAPGGAVGGSSSTDTADPTATTDTGATGGSDNPPPNSATGGGDSAAVLECIKNAAGDVAKIQACAPTP